MEPNKNNKTDIFLENYDKGNKALESLLNTYSIQILSDIDVILNEKEQENDINISLGNIKSNLSNTNESPYNKIIYMGNTLNSSLPNIVNIKNPLILRKTYNILSNYLGLAKESQDSRILDSASQIMKNLKMSGKL